VSPSGKPHVSTQAPESVTVQAGSADALARARADFHTLLEMAPEPALLHREGTVVYANPALTQALGYASGEQLVASRLLDLLHQDDRSVAEGPLVTPAANTAAPWHRVPVRWRCVGGGVRATEAVAALVDYEGEPAIVVLARDVTELAESQHQLLQRDRMAALGTLSAGVAHEINNPLTYLLVNLDYVMRRLRAASASDDPMGELARGMHGGGLPALVQSLQQSVDGANRVRQIVRDLLTFSQGSVEQRGITDVRGIVESAVQMAWHEIRHRARLVKSLADVPPVDANEARLGQVFLNLLVNAAQAIPEGHADANEIRVSTRTDEAGNAIVEVRDTGVGIEPQVLPRIFDPFFTTKGECGTGLGLSISHGTVRALGGRIEVESERGKGASFRIVLPPAKPWRASAQASPSDVRAMARRRVLVIDDEPLVGEAVARSLAEDNDVQIVTDAKQGLARIEAGEKFDVILCDLMMPVMTGMDLYAEVVRRAPKLAGKIVFMTGGAFTPRARAFLESVVNPCLEKPLDMPKLRSILARAGRE